MSDVAPPPNDQHPPRAWKPLGAIDRRVLGVLVEKAKTTPDGYPMSVNSLRSGCNQKNNRYPLMELEIEDVDESLARLRAQGAVTEVQGGGRVPRFRHHMYEWLGVDKVESAVMTELLLRGAQTEGELRGRAARMEPIPDLNSLRPVLASLKTKGLIVSLTPDGRGHALTHALYEPRELEKVRAEFQAAGPTRDATEDEPQPAPAVARVAPTGSGPQSRVENPSSSDSSSLPAQAIEQLRRELDEVRAEMATLRKDFDDLWSNFR